MKTNTKKQLKASIVTLCALLLIFATILGTLAYLTDRETVENTFTIGNIDIKLDNADNGNVIVNGGQGVNGKLKLVPGVKVERTPTVTVKKGSEECYVRILVTISNYDALKTAAATHNMIDDANNNKVVISNLLADLGTYWTEKTEGFKYETTDGGTATYEFRYNAPVNALNADADSNLNALFTGYVAPGVFNNSEMEAFKTMKVTVVAHAIQTASFNNDVDAAWTAFGVQNP